MSWQLLTQIAPSIEWQVSPSTNGGIFRLTFQSPPPLAEIRIGQCSNGLLWVEPETIVVSRLAQLIHLLPPEGLPEERQIAIRLSSRDFQEPGWIVNLEVEDTLMPLTRNTGSQVASTVNATTVVSTKDASNNPINTQLLAANANRKGFAITNLSGTLYLELGATATSAAYTAVLYPGDYYESPFNYVGVVAGLWSIGTGSALVREFM